MARVAAEQVAHLGSSADAITLIAATLENVVRHNHDLRQTQPTSFDAVSAPAITVHRYLSRIRQYTKFQDECYVVALVYLDRLFQNHKAPFLPTAHNVHRLIITSVLLASKFYDGAPPPRSRAPPPNRPAPQPAPDAFRSIPPSRHRAIVLAASRASLLRARRRLPLQLVHGAGWRNLRGRDEQARDRALPPAQLGAPHRP